jgi:hypothetical protein
MSDAIMDRAAAWWVHLGSMDVYDLAALLRAIDAEATERLIRQLKVARAETARWRGRAEQKASERAGEVCTQIEMLTRERDAAQAEVDKWKAAHQQLYKVYDDLSEQEQRTQAEVEHLRYVAVERDEARAALAAARAASWLDGRDLAKQENVGTLFEQQRALREQDDAQWNAAIEACVPVVLKAQGLTFTAIKGIRALRRPLGNT